MPNNDMESFKKELEADGLSLEGQLKTETPDDKAEAEAKAAEEAEKAKEADAKAKKEAEVKTKTELEAIGGEKTERAPREPKLIPAWKVEMEKKRTEKAEEEKNNAFEQELNKLKSELEELKGRPKEQKTEDAISKLATKYEVQEEFLRELFAIVPKEENGERLKKIDVIEEERRIEREDREYEQSFNSKVIPLLKAQNPELGEDEINSVREALKKDYFSEKYVSLDADEIYRLKSDSLASLITPPKKQTAEKGTKGLSRDGKVVDYDNVTEEQYAKMSDEEQEKVDQYKIAKQKAR